MKIKSMNKSLSEFLASQPNAKVRNLHTVPNRAHFELMAALEALSNEV
jgi:hypothetical protein